MSLKCKILTLHFIVQFPVKLFLNFSFELNFKLLYTITGIYVPFTTLLI